MNSDLYNKIMNKVDDHISQNFIDVAGFGYGGFVVCNYVMLPVEVSIREPFESNVKIKSRKYEF